MKTWLRAVMGLSLAFGILAAPAARAQWPSDPAVNMVLSNLSGSQTITKIVPATDGGCYVSWWDNTSGNYDVYMQKLDGSGVIQWPENGLLISDNPQDTWLTDYDLAVDSANYAIVAVNDIRSGLDRDIFAYRISPDGNSVWGADGLTISNNNGFEPDPRVIALASGNIVFAWQEENVVHLRKVTPEGADVWDPATITLTSQYGLSIPRITTAENDGVILQFLVAQGPNYYDPKHIYAHKFDSLGVEVWDTSGVPVQTAGGFGPQMRPDIASDAAGGAYSFWYDSRNNVLHAFAQHIRSDGSRVWTLNGVSLSTSSSELQMMPACVRHLETGDLMFFYENTDYNQTVLGVYAQKLDSTGARQWGNTGLALVPMSNQVRMLIHACELEADAVVTYLESPVGDVVNSRLMAIRVDPSGAPVWDPSPAIMTTTLSQKGYLDACINNLDQVIAAWEDYRDDPDGDAYLQNINPDGSFGSIGPRCVYNPGDVGGSGIFNGLDVTYSVNYFKGGSPPAYICECTPGNFWYVAGDVNNSCTFNGIDVTYMVAYFKGGPEPIPCQDCPPAGVVAY